MRETEGGQSPEYILKTSKNTIFNEPPVYRKNETEGERVGQRRERKETGEGER